jgi:hypothetical protein
MTLEPWQLYVALCGAATGTLGVVLGVLNYMGNDGVIAGWSGLRPRSLQFMTSAPANHAKVSCSASRTLVIAPFMSTRSTSSCGGAECGGAGRRSPSNRRLTPGPAAMAQCANRERLLLDPAHSTFHRPSAYPIFTVRGHSLRECPAISC